MANHKIVIDINDPKTINAAIRELDKIQKKFDAKVDKFLEEIAEIGRNAAQQEYGTKAVTVTKEPTGDGGWVIRASGDAVVFFEFGAGKATDATERYAGEMPFPVHVGSYSIANGGEFAATGFEVWHFGGQPYHEVEQRPGMLRAYEAIMQEIPNVAKRVFG
ncbi:MAG: hypothetical protein IJI45_01310 [Anaerolineaceae bacterium]|nr:hypothetical protein [Anaerolineaceae bacterium]